MDNFAQLVTEAKKAGLISDKPKSTTGTEQTPLQLCEFLSTLPFWCGDVTLHKKNPDYKHTAKCCMTHIVGLPRHSATNEEMPLTPYQIEFVNEILSRSQRPTDPKELEAFLRTAHYYHINKGRQMGFTEIVLRLIQFFCFSKYAGSNIGIIAATNGNLAKKDLRRLARLYKSIPGVVRQWIKSNVMEIVNDTIIEAFPASEEAITGDTRYKCIFKDESAKWRQVDDTPVFNSVQPIIDASGGDLFLVSTPKGPIKTFYDITQTKNDYIRLEYNIWRTKGNLYTEKEIKKKLENSIGDPEQEYLCKFKTGKDSIFGTVSPDDQKGKVEWIMESEHDVEKEDDYDEDKDEDGIHWHEK